VQRSRWTQWRPRRWARDVLGMQPAVDRRTCRARRCGTRPRPRWRCTGASGSWDRAGSCGDTCAAPGASAARCVAAQTASLSRHAPSRSEQRGVLNAGRRSGSASDGSSARRADSRMLCAVVPLVRGERFPFPARRVDELVALPRASRGLFRHAAAGRRQVVPRRRSAGYCEHHSTATVQPIGSRGSLT